jgi:hypothetical protein
MPSFSAESSSGILLNFHADSSPRGLTVSDSNQGGVSLPPKNRMPSQISPFVPRNRKLMEPILRYAAGGNYRFIMNGGSPWHSD